MANLSSFYTTSPLATANSVAGMTANNANFLGGTAANGYARLANSVFTGPVSGITTLAAGNTTISGFVTSTGASKIATNVAQAAPSNTDIATTSHAQISGYGGNALWFGQYDSGTGFAQWIQSSYTNPTTATYNIIFQPIGGNVGFGNTSPTHKISVNGTSYFGNNINIVGTTTLQQTIEKAAIIGSAATGTINFDVLDQAVVHYTTNASANWTINLRANSSTTIDSILAANQSLTIAFLANQGSTAYYANVFQVDGGTRTVKWQGGTTPTGGNANSVDMYVYTVMKTAANTYSVYGAQTRFA